MPGGHGFQNGVSRQTTLVDWRIRHDWQVTGGAPRQEVVLDPPTRQVVDNLVGNDVGSVWQPEQLLHIGQIKVADAPVTNQTIVPQNVKRIYCLFQWHAATPVQQVKVQSIGPQTLQAPLAGDDRAMASGMLG